MVTKLKMFVVIAVANMLLTAASAARAEEIPLVAGQQWVQSSEQVKKAYLVGIANIVQVELAYESGNAPRDEQSFIPRLARGLRGETLDTVRQKLDQWYAAHPDKLERPIIETIWFEMVLPGLARNK